MTWRAPKTITGMARPGVSIQSWHGRTSAEGLRPNQGVVLVWRLLPSLSSLAFISLRSPFLHQVTGHSLCPGGRRFGRTAAPWASCWADSGQTLIGFSRGGLGNDMEIQGLYSASSRSSGTPVSCTPHGVITGLHLPPGGRFLRLSSAKPTPSVTGAPATNYIYPGLWVPWTLAGPSLSHPDGPR